MGGRRGIILLTSFLYIVAVVVAPSESFKVAQNIEIGELYKFTINNQTSLGNSFPQ
jgi:hypothetical protein